PAVSPTLVLPLYLGRGPPFEVELDTSKVPLGLYVPTAVLYRHAAVRVQDPFGGRTVHGRDPLVHVPAVKEHYGIAGRGPIAARDHPWGHRMADFRGLGFRGFHFLGLAPRAQQDPQGQKYPFDLRHITVP